METIKADLVILDYKLYPRSGIDDYHVARLSQALHLGRDLPPIIVDKKSKRVIDGFHRVKAYQKIHGQYSDVPVEYHEYETEADLFLDSMLRNSKHGCPLTVYDQARCITIAEDLEINPAVIAEALCITPQKLSGIACYRTATYFSKTVPLKATTSHFAGKDLTPKQMDYNTIAGGLQQSYYVNQVIAMLEAGTADPDNERLMELLRKLYDLLHQRLREPLEVE